MLTFYDNSKFAFLLISVKKRIGFYKLSISIIFAAFPPLFPAFSPRYPAFPP